MDKKLLIVSANKSVVTITALYKGGRLMIHSCNSFPLADKKKAKALQADMKLKANDGYTVAVDETMPFFGLGYLKTGLVDNDKNGRLILAVAMEAYQNFNIKNAIRFNDNVNIGRITDDLIDQEPDEQGGIRYRVSWDDFKQEQAALLVTIYNAVTDLQDKNYLKAMFNHINKGRRISPPMVRR